MPRPPDFAPVIRDRPGSPYSDLLERVSKFEGEVYRLNVGDTWMEPAPRCRMEAIATAEHPGMHRYAPVQGTPALLDAVAAHVRKRTGVATEREHVLIGAGVTGLLDAVARTLVQPGDEVLIPSPHWPLVAGAVRGVGGTAVQLPFFTELGPDATPEDAVAEVAKHKTSRTTTLYLNTPSNPTGRVLPASWVAALAAWARRENLWIWADEVYEDFVYRGQHEYTRPHAPERTLSLHSFSKAYGMAGNRCGYMIAPPEVVAQVVKASTFTYYSTPTAAQIAGVRALGPDGDAWIADAKKRYQETGDAVAARLGEPPPDGCTFLFLDVADTLARELPRVSDPRLRLTRLLERLADHGVVVAPGPSFGPYHHHIRACFTSEPPEKARRGFELLAQVLGR